MKKKSILVIVSLLFLYGYEANAQPSNGKAIVMLWAPTNDTLTSSVQLREMQVAKQNFEILAQEMKLEVEFFEILGDNFTRNDIDSVVENLIRIPHPGKEKKMVLFVMGWNYGFNYERPYSLLPDLIFSSSVSNCGIDSNDNVVSLKSISEKLIDEGRFDHLHFFIDASNFATGRIPPPCQPITIPISTMDLAASNHFSSPYEQLFYSVKTSIFTGASYDELSFYDMEEGSFFTNAVWKSIEAIRVGDIKPEFKGQNGFLQHIIMGVHASLEKLIDYTQTPQVFLQKYTYVGR